MLIFRSRGTTGSSIPKLEMGILGRQRAVRKISRRCATTMLLIAYNLARLCNGGP